VIRDSRLRIILLGYIVRGPLAGLAWHYLQYVLALTRLGHEVYFFEDSDDYASCYNPETNTQSTDPSYGLQFLSSAMGELGLAERWAYYDAHKAVWRGPCADQALAICATADLFLNVSAVNPIRPWLMAVPVRVLVDTDPAFTQVRHLTSADARTRAACHTAFFSFGENLSAGLSSIPDDGFQWQATRQPVVLDAWAVTPAPPAGSYTSVMLWEAYPAIEYHGRRYGPKADSFGPFLDLPTRTGPVFELAFGSRTQPGKMMKEHGWTLIDPREPSRSLGHYRDYIQASRAEFGVAKHGYVVSRSGWFSERSALYLASGRPVLVQDTGFGEWLRTSEGVLPFRTVEDVLAGVDAINERYRTHCDAARAVAETYFSAPAVLTRLLELAIHPETRRPAPGSEAHR
jgi:hypothetical protein